MAPELTRSSQSKQFEERLEASIEEVGLAEPLKVCSLEGGGHLIVDGVMRYRAIASLRSKKPGVFKDVPVYVVDRDKRFELRYQTDIYQDLLPSQLATLVEHLHKTERVTKADIGRYIGVSPPTVRNYTGLWRLLQRGGLFARLVKLMDVGVVPASNPYAWLRLTAAGLRHVLETAFSDGQKAESWIENRVARARHGDVAPIPIKLVEEATGNLPPEYYKEDQQRRAMKRDIGKRRATVRASQLLDDATEALKNLDLVEATSDQLVLRSAASAMKRYISK